jgi:chemotaxis protein MotB
MSSSLASSLGICGAVLVAASGCAFVPRSQLVSCEAQSRELAEQSKAQVAEIANLKAHNRTVENRLIKAEEELALVQERSGLDRERLSNFETERQQLGADVKSWARNASHDRPGRIDPRLRQVSERYEGLKLDTRTGLCKLEDDVLFESGEATLKPEARSQLDALAKLLKSPEGHELRIMVVGHTDSRIVGKRETRDRYPDNWRLSTARALAVADYLQRAGLPEDQIGVAGYGRHQPLAANQSPDTRQRNRRVELFLLGPETPIVGWAETSSGLYR